MIDAILLGTGGTRPLPTRALASLVLRYEGASLLFDCGEGSQVNFMKSGLSIFDLDYIFITHLHADHVLGFAGIVATLSNLQRVKPLQIFGPPGVKRLLSGVLEGLFGCPLHLPFLISFFEYGSNDVTLNFGQFQIRAFRVDHTVPCYGYVFEEIRPNRFSREIATVCIPSEYWGVFQQGYRVNVNGKAYFQEQLFGPKRAGLKIVYVTDTRPTAELVRNSLGANLLVLEGMHPTVNSGCSILNSKHMAVSEAVEIASVCDADRLWLTHFSPGFHPKSPDVKTAQRVFPQTVFGKDGMTLSLEHTDITAHVMVSAAQFDQLWRGESVTVMSNGLSIDPGARVHVVTDEGVQQRVCGVGYRFIPVEIVQRGFEKLIVRRAV